MSGEQATMTSLASVLADRHPSLAAEQPAAEGGGEQPGSASNDAKTGETAATGDGDKGKADKATTAADKKGATPAPAAKDTPAETDDEADSHPVPRKALIEERKKRQQLEARMAELESRSTAPAPRPVQTDQQPTDPNDAFYAQGPAAFVRTTVEQATRQARFELSESLMREVHEDYDGKVNALVAELAKPENIGHRQQFQMQLAAAPNPAKFAYEYAKTYQEVGEAGSVDELRAKVRQELRAEVEAEVRKQLAMESASQASTSSAGARGSGATSAPIFSGPTPLGTVFPKRV